MNVHSTSRPSKGMDTLYLEQGKLCFRGSRSDLPGIIIKANCALQKGDHSGAVALLNQCDDHQFETLSVDEGMIRTDVLFLLGKLFYDTHQWARARHWLERTVRCEPHALAYYFLAEICLKRPDSIREAVKYSQKAVECRPHEAYLRDKLGHCLHLAGQARTALCESQKAVDLCPADSSLLERLLWRKHYVPETRRSELLEGYRCWGMAQEVSLPDRSTYDNVPDTHRTLRIGFISPDFHRGSVASSFEPFLDGYDRAALEITAYDCMGRTDQTTHRLIGKLDRYINVHNWDKDTIASKIRDDKIDILVEMGGHCAGNRLDVLMLKPAPIQVDYGGISTTGLANVDYRLTDRVIDPPEVLSAYVERSVYLDGGLASFKPPRESPIITPLPAKSKGYVTFGSFNNNAKITPEQLEIWARILAGLPDAQLVMKFPAADDPDLRMAYQEQFNVLGISSSRIRFVGSLPYHEYLSLLSEVDLALDTFPYNGCITTLEGLWMGVPILTLTGDTYVSRVGLSILHRLGLELFSCTEPDEYVAKAYAFTNHLDDLETLRYSLRGQLLQSPLCSPTRLADEMRVAFQSMWRQWCSEYRG